MRSTWIVVCALLLTGQRCQAIITEAEFYTKHDNSQQINLFVFINDDLVLPGENTQKDTAEQRTHFIDFLKQINDPYVVVEDLGSSQQTDKTIIAYCKLLLEEQSSHNFLVGLTQKLATNTIPARNVEFRHLLFASSTSKDKTLSAAIVKTTEKGRAKLAKIIGSIKKFNQPLTSYLDNVLNGPSWKKLEPELREPKEQANLRSQQWLDYYQDILICNLLVYITTAEQTNTSICLAVSRQTANALLASGALETLGFHLRHKEKTSPVTMITTTTTFTSLPALNIKQVTDHFLKLLAQNLPKRRTRDLSIEVPKHTPSQQGSTPRSPLLSPTTPTKGILKKAPSPSPITASPSTPKNVRWPADQHLTQAKDLTPKEAKKQIEHEQILAANIRKESLDKITELFAADSLDTKTIASFMASLAWAAPLDTFHDEFYNDLIDVISKASEALEAKKLTIKEFYVLLASLRSNLRKAFSFPEIKEYLQEHQIAALQQWLDSVTQSDAQTIVNVIQQAAKTLDTLTVIGLARHALEAQRQLNNSLKIKQIKFFLESAFIAGLPDDDVNAQHWSAMLK